NSSVEGHFLFGGTRTDQAPYQLVADGTSNRVVYSGASAAREVEISRGAFLPVGTPGDALFGASGRSKTIVQTQTGAAAAAAGGDNGVGSTILRIRHVATVY